MWWEGAEWVGNSRNQGPLFSVGDIDDKVKGNNFCETRRWSAMWPRDACTTCNTPTAATRLQTPRAVMAAVQPRF